MLVLWFHVLGNGFIEAGELDEFLKALWKEGHPGKVKTKRLLCSFLAIAF